MIDLHCHLDLYPNPRGVARECSSRGMYVLSVTNAPSAWRGTSAVAHGSPRVRTALGLHPQLAHERRSELDLFEQLLPETQYVGEVGLDGTPDARRHWDDQVKVFRRILVACSMAGGRVLSIHSRRAASPVLDMIEKAHGAGAPILHWFSGTSTELARAEALGCWFSVGATMLATAKGRALVDRMPRDRVLTESDGPFAQLDGKPAQPWDVERAVSALAEVWKVQPADAAALIRANLRRLLAQAKADSSIPT